MNKFLLNKPNERYVVGIIGMHVYCRPYCIMWHRHTYSTTQNKFSDLMLSDALTYAANPHFLALQTVVEMSATEEGHQY